MVVDEPGKGVAAVEAGVGVVAVEVGEGVVAVEAGEGVVAVVVGVGLGFQDFMLHLLMLQVQIMIYIHT